MFLENISLRFNKLSASMEIGTSIRRSIAKDILKRLGLTYVMFQSCSSHIEVSIKDSMG